MGTWRIQIEGHGIHDNGRPDDADAIAADAVKRLVEAGHEVSSATFTLTGPTRELAPEAARSISVERPGDGSPEVVKMAFAGNVLEPAGG